MENERTETMNASPKFWSVEVWTGPDGARVLRMRLNALGDNDAVAAETITGMFPPDFFATMESLIVVKPVDEIQVCTLGTLEKQHAAMKVLCQQAQENTNTLNQALYQRRFRRHSL